ncbi:MAG: sensor histidine kinase [Flavobacteriales bacterium]|nr:MAG: sensor histidine kinase [Flavobacteriales bacterium]
MTRCWMLVPVLLACIGARATDRTRADSLFRVGDYAGVLQEYLTELEQAERVNDDLSRAQATMRVGRAHYYLRHKDEARSWFARAITIAQGIGADTLVAKCQRNMGAVLWEQGRIDSARYYLERAEPVLLRQDNASELATFYGILFELRFRAEKDTVEGERLAHLGERYARRTGDPERIAFALMKRGILLMETGRCEESLDIFREGEELYERGGHLEGRMYALSSLANAMGLCGRAVECMMLYRQHNILRDSLFNARTADRAAHYQAIFDTQQKEIENLALRERNQRIIGAGVLSVLLVGFLSFVVYKRRELQRQRMHALRLREEQLQRFREVVGAQETERARIAADLHDGIGHQLGAIKLSTSVLHGRDEREQTILDKSRAMIDDAARDVRQVSHRLMPRSLEDLGLVPALRELAERLSTSGTVRVLFTSASEDIPLDEAVRIALYRIAQEVTNNMLKHAQAQEIRILLEREQALRMTITDDGRGFDTAELERSDGLGWRNVHARLELIGGRLHLRSAPGEGTSVQVEVPMNATDR